MKISLIMGTINREKLVIRAINALLNQIYDDWEVIVIDQSEIGSTTIPQLDQRVRYINVKEKGLSKARNYGIKLAKGDIIGLMDDDAVYSKDALFKVNTHFSENSSLLLLSGKIVNFGQQVSKNVQNDVKKISWSNFMEGLCISPSIFIRKTFFDDHSFDENLGVGCYLGSAEESDIVAKILYTKQDALYDPSIIVFHHTGESKYEIEMKRHASYCRGFGAFCAKHIVLYKNRHIKKIYHIRKIRTTCGLFLAYLSNDKFLINLYKTTLLSRGEGYKLYKQLLNEGEIDR